jgi:hypothetical protein
LLVVTALLVVASPASAATCADYSNQAAAQRAADTRDPDGDGLYCESLPCPCLGPTTSGGDAPTPTPAPPAPRPGCIKPSGVQNLTFSKAKYPHFRAHFLAAVRKGWPRTLVLDRAGASARRDRLLGGFPTRAGYDRDEYPPAVGRGLGKGLVGGSDPRGWKADVRYVDSAENESHGSSLGGKLRRFCNGTRFRYLFF